ncbi:MAG: hypothetical protein WCR67_05480 [Bacilli bacterium]
MLNELDYKRLDSYFGFARRKRALFVGLELDDKIIRNKVCLLLILKDCSQRSHDELLRLANDAKNVCVMEYSGNYPVPLSVGYKSLKAVGVTDPYLSKEIRQLLLKDETDVNHKEENK